MYDRDDQPAVHRVNRLCKENLQWKADVACNEEYILKMWGLEWLIIEENFEDSKFDFR